jgi:hypothetical protein
MNAMISAIVVWLVLFGGLQRRVRVSQEMTWVCTSEHDFQGIQWVEFRFVENPHYIANAAGQGLCDALKFSGKRTVRMKFELKGDVSGYRGNNALEIEGLSGDVSGGAGGIDFGLTGPGPDPLKRVFDNAR